MANGYLSKQVTFKDSSGRNFVFFPEGNEGIFLTIYIAMLPYLAGLFFVYFFIFKLNLNLFSELVDISGTSFMVHWFIGYEFLASFTLLFIIYKAVTYKGESSFSNYNQRNNNFNKKSQNNKKRRFV